MSEQPMGPEATQSPKDVALAYIQYRDIARPSGKLRKKEMKQMGSEPPRGVWKETELSAATAYERTLSRLDDNSAKRAMESMRPFAYDMARLYRYTAGIGEWVLGGAFLFAADKLVPKVGPGWGRAALNLGGPVATAIFRPVEYVAARGMDVVGVVGSEVVAPIVNNIFKGGEPRPATPVATPA